MQREFHFYIIILFLLSTLNINAQNIRLHDNTYLLNEHYFSSDGDFHLTVKPFTPHDLLELDTLKKAKVSIKIADYLLNKDLIKYESANFNITSNPIIDSKVFYDLNEASIYSDFKLGLNLESSFKEKLFFSAVPL